MLNSPDIRRFCKILSTRKGQKKNKKSDTIIPVILWAEVKWKPLIIIAGITETFKPNTMATATTVQTPPPPNSIMENENYHSELQDSTVNRININSRRSYVRRTADKATTFIKEIHHKTNTKSNRLITYDTQLKTTPFARRSNLSFASDWPEALCGTYS